MYTDRPSLLKTVVRMQRFVIEFKFNIKLHLINGTLQYYTLHLLHLQKNGYQFTRYFFKAITIHM